MVTVRSSVTDLLTGQEPLPAVSVFVDLLSLVRYSLSATLLLDDHRVEGFGQ
ncbi:MAG: hypothetical protein KJ000_24560 [Pirellulaceae bacterium]|nr:hypothetical protein [Pirellulaceae bacterium]